MPSRTVGAVFVFCAFVSFCVGVADGQTRHKGRVQTPGNNPLVAREQVSIDGGGQYRTTDGGEFEFDLTPPLKVGQPARFHVYHLNPAIKIRQWIVIHPCDLLNGRKDSLPDVEAEPVSIVVLPSGDPRLKSLNQEYSILGCIIEEAAAEFPKGESSIIAARASDMAVDPSQVFSYVGPANVVEATYHVLSRDKPADSAFRDDPASTVLNRASLEKRSANLGFTSEELAEALDAWTRSADGSYHKGLAALYRGHWAEASEYISASIPANPGEFLKRYVPLARAEYEQGHYAAAESALRKVLAAHPEDPMILSNLGVVLTMEGKYGGAEPLLGRALAIDEKEFGLGDPEVAADLMSMAVLYLSQGKSTEAAQLCERAIAIDEKVLGSNDPEVARGLDNLAAAYEIQKRYTEAEPLLKRAIAIGEKTEPDDPHLAARLNNLASVYESQGKYSDAELLFKKALEIDMKAVGPHHPMVASCLNNLASVYDDEGKFAEAEALFKSALEIDLKALGKDHPDVATDLNNLASAYFHQGKYSDAEPLFRQALAVDEKAFGRNHPTVAVRLNNLAADLRGLGRDREAKVYEDRAARIGAEGKRRSGPNAPN
jgi:tetratricopeptide (TPR) repeat protein